jgi:hypothetical protein
VSEETSFVSETANWPFGSFGSFADLLLLADAGGGGAEEVGVEVEEGGHGDLLSWWVG